MFVLLQGIRRACRHSGLTDLQIHSTNQDFLPLPTKQGYFPLSNRVINLQMLFCNPGMLLSLPGWRGQKQEGMKRRICSSWILFASLCPGNTHPWCSRIAFHPQQFYTNKVILWSQHSYESLHTFLGWNTNCLTSWSKLHNCSQNGIQEAVSN